MVMVMVTLVMMMDTVMWHWRRHAQDWQGTPLEVQICTLSKLLPCHVHTACSHACGVLLQPSSPADAVVQ